VDPWGLEVTAKLLDNGTVSIVDSDNNQVGILTVTSYKPTLNEYRTGDFNVGAEIEMVYKDSGSGYTDFNFIQTVQSIENRQPLSKRLDAPKLSEPFYNTPQETATYGISNGAYFSDSPTRQNPVDPISWEAETSLVGKNNQGKYEAMATIKWGFNYSPVTETVTGIPPALIQTPSSFHQEKVQSANKCED
jgi:hypothetical protein